MPRISGVYVSPVGTTAIPNTTVASAPYNANVYDVAQDLNTPRPIVAGGTGANTAAGALANLGALPLAGGTMTGPLVTTDLWTVRDAAHGGSTNGIVNFGNTGNKYLFFDGTKYQLVGGLLQVSDLLISRESTPAIGVVYFGDATHSLSYDGAGTYAFNGGTALNVAGDLKASRTAAPTTGYVNLGTPGKSIGYDGAKFVMDGDTRVVGDVTAYRSATPTQGAYFFGTGASAYLYYNGSTFQLQGGNLIHPSTAPAKPGGGPWADSSDARIKNVLGPYEHGLAEVLQLEPVRFKFKGNDGETHKDVASAGTEFVGLIAQAVEPVMPEMVLKRDGYIDGGKVDDLRTLDTNALVYALVNAVKELSARVQALEASR